MISQLALNNREIQSIEALLDDLEKQFSNPEDPVFLLEAAVFAHDLPLNVRKFINEFRLTESADAVACIISGYPVDNQRIGTTPIDRGLRSDIPQTLREQLLLVLVASLLGDLVGWSTQQAGRLMHDILPVKNQEYDQMGSSSAGELMLHTEDAFHPHRCDYMGIMCLRNQERALTSLASTQAISQLTERQIKKLFEPCCVIRPDASQFEKQKTVRINHSGEQDSQEWFRCSADKIHKMNNAPDPVSVLFGDLKSPYMRIDCDAYLEALDDEADDAIRALQRALESTIVNLEFAAGKFCFIDNYRAVHGRSAFKARYDGTDRWLKRVNITRDIRKSRNIRKSSTSRVMF